MTNALNAFVRQLREVEPAHAARAHDLDRDATDVGVARGEVELELVVGRLALVRDVQDRHVQSLLQSCCIPEASRSSPAHHGSGADLGVAAVASRAIVMRGATTQ